MLYPAKPFYGSRERHKFITARAFNHRTNLTKLSHDIASRNDALGRARKLL